LASAMHVCVIAPNHIQVKFVLIYLSNPFLYYSHIIARPCKFFAQIVQHQDVISKFKDRVHCFSMQVVMNKCFLLNPEKKIWRRSVLSFSTKNAYFNSEKWRYLLHNASKKFEF